MRRFKIASFCTKLNPPKSGPRPVPEIDFSTKITIRKKLPCIMSLGCNIFIICLREKQFMFSNQYADKFRHKVCTLHHYFRILRLKINYNNIVKVCSDSKAFGPFSPFQELHQTKSYTSLADLNLKSLCKRILGAPATHCRQLFWSLVSFCHDVE